jgi:hypothetical protein
MASLSTCQRRFLGDGHEPEVCVPLTHRQTRTVDGVKIFCREAHPKDGPTVLLLHDFPTSSHMFHNLSLWRTAITSSRQTSRLPPPSSSHSSVLSRACEFVEGLPQKLGSSAMHVRDGLRHARRPAPKHPDAITGLIIPNPTRTARYRNGDDNGMSNVVSACRRCSGSTRRLSHGSGARQPSTVRQLSTSQTSNDDAPAVAWFPDQQLGVATLPGQCWLISAYESSPCNGQRCSK